MKLMSFFAVFLLACEDADPTTNADTGTDIYTDAGTNVDTGTETDTDADTGTEIDADNCGGPEPPPESIWQCEEGPEGPTWPTAGGPSSGEPCMTTEGWKYEVSPEGDFVLLVKEEDERELNCYMQ